MAIALPAASFTPRRPRPKPLSPIFIFLPLEGAHRLHNQVKKAAASAAGSACFKRLATGNTCLNLKGSMSVGVLKPSTDNHVVKKSPRALIPNPSALRAPQPSHSHKLPWKWHD